ncbi:MAG: TonB-dependent receptor, partial [Opitutales bacterium]|nr:TonB-dependent receptor [Opitutales bacterium]
NPSDNWRISMNYANTELVQTNIANDVVDWFADNRALWDANGDLSTGNLTIAEEVEELENWIASRKQLEGSMAQGSKEHTFRMFTRYDFDEGLLAGFHIGGGARYISGSAIAADANGNVIRGEGQTMFDLVTGYKFEIREGFPVRVQLNINNLLDETDPYFTRAKVSGVVDRYTLPTPRQFRLSASFDF